MNARGWLRVNMAWASAFTPCSVWILFSSWRKMEIQYPSAFLGFLWAFWLCQVQKTFGAREFRVSLMGCSVAHNCQEHWLTLSCFLLQLTPGFGFFCGFIQQKFLSNGPGGATLNVSSFKWLFRLPLLVLPINGGYKDKSLWFSCTDTGTERTRAVPKSCSIPGRHHMSPPLQRIPGLRPPLRSNLAKEPGCPRAGVRSSTSLHCGTLFRFPLPCLHLCGCPKALQTSRVCKPRKSACTEERWGTNAAFAITSLSFHQFCLGGTVTTGSHH